MKTNMEFFALLDDTEQDDLLKFARAYMRVRELHGDKSFPLVERDYFRNLEEKLVKFLEDTTD